VLRKLTATLPRVQVLGLVPFQARVELQAPAPVDLQKRVAAELQLATRASTRRP